MIIGNFEGALQLKSTNLVVFFMMIHRWINNTLTTALLLLCASTFRAQDIDVKWSEDRTSSKITASELIGRDGTGFYIYRQKNPDDDFLQLNHYQYNDYQRTSSIDIPLPTVGKKPTQLEKIFWLNDHFLLFTSYFDKDNDQNRAFATLLNKNGETIKSMFEVDRIENVTSKKNTGHFAFQLSPDSNFVMAFHNTPFRAEENANFSVKLYDSGLNHLWQKKFKMPYSDEDFEVVTALVDNNENIYMVCKLYGQGFMRASEMNANKKYTLFHYNHLGRKLTEYEINVDNKWIHSARFQMLNDSTLLAGGFYSGTGKGNIAGSFYVRFNMRSGKLVDHGFENLPRSTVIDITYNDDLLFGGLASFELRKMLPRQDGSMVLVAEKSYTTTSSYFDPYTGQRLVNYYYHDDDLLLVSMSSNGKMEWTTVIPKNQTNSNGEGNYSSIAVNMFRDEVYIVFNDHPGNVNMVREPGEMRTLTNFSKSTAMMAQVGRSGGLTLRPLFSNPDFDAILRPQFSNETHTHRQLIYGERNGKDKFGEIFYPKP